MIIVRLNGGLGNQMFQYAFGRALSIKHGTNFKIDTSRAYRTPARRYRANLLNIKEELSNPEELKTLPVINEKHFYYDPSVLKHKRGYFCGYWQSEKYFKDIEDIVFDELGNLSEASRRQLTKEDLEIIEQMKNTESVSFNVRRGDFSGQEHLLRIHGWCDQNYFCSAEQKLNEAIPESRKKDIVYFVFSDDIDFVKENFTFDRPTVFVSKSYTVCEIDNNCINNRDHLDLFILSHCRNHMISNSTYFWWGAYLSKFRYDHTPVVIAPNRWFRDTNLQSQTKDLLPKEWITV